MTLKTVGALVFAGAMLAVAVLACGRDLAAAAYVARNRDLEWSIEHE